MCRLRPPFRLPRVRVRPLDRDPREAALQAWRDGVRNWPCHLYAYAVPNEAALTTLTALGPLVEMGAGAGYWARLLKMRGAKVLPMDVHPQGDGDHVNAYHGQTPPHIKGAFAMSPGGDLAGVL